MGLFGALWAIWQCSRLGSVGPSPTGSNRPRLPLPREPAANDPSGTRQRMLLRSKADGRFGPFATAPRPATVGEERTLSKTQFEHQC